MERSENEIHQTLHDLAAIGGLLPRGENKNDTGAVDDPARSAGSRLPEHQQQHTFRRLLRRLDRSLLRLEEQICNEAESQLPPLSDELCHNLLTILTRLALIDEDTAMEMCLSIHSTVARIWTGQELCITDPQDVRTLMRRIVQQVETVGTAHHQHSFFLQCAPWVKVLNVYFCDMHQSPVLSVDDAVWQLQRILLVALDSFRAQSSWDVNMIQHAESEAICQWRHLATFIAEQVIQLYHTSPLSPESQQQLSVQEWLEKGFGGSVGTSTTTVDLARQAVTNNASRNQYAARSAVRELLGNLQTFADELVEFALDALDGAAAAVAAVDTTNGRNGEGDKNEHSKSDAVRDSLRHSVTASRFLQALNDWSLVRPEWPLRLWKSLATAFVVRPEYTEEERLIVREIGSSIVHFTLTVLEMVLDMSDEHELPTASLATTFLRALEYPERLLGMEGFWGALKSHAAQNNELKQVLQVALLSLQTSSGTNVISSSLSANSERSSTQVLVHRIQNALPDHLVESASQQSTSCCQNDPWDAFFTKRFNDLSK